MITIKLQLELLASVIFKPLNNMWLQLELLVFLALFALSFNDVESRSAGLESVKPISRSIREAHRGNGKRHPPPKRPPCPNRKKCPKRPNHKKPHPHPKRRPPPRKPLPNQQVTVTVQTDTKSDVANSNNAHYHTIINHFHHWVPLPFFNITEPNSTITPQPTTIIQHFKTRPVEQELTTPQTSPASNCSDVTNRGPCTGSANQQNTSINIHLNVALPPFYNHNGFPPPVAPNNLDNRKNASNTQNGTEPSSTKSEQQTTTEKSTTTTTKIVQTSIKPNIEPLTTTSRKPLEESTKTTVTKLTTTTVKPLKVPETNGQKPDNEDEQLDPSFIRSTPSTGRKLPPKSPTTNSETSSVANGKDDGAHVQNEIDALGPLIDIRYQQ